MTAAAPAQRPLAPPPPAGKGCILLVLAVVVPAAVLAWGAAAATWPPAILLLPVPALLALPFLVRGRLRISRSLIFYEMLRSARRDRDLVFRCVYACLLLGALCWFYVSWFAGRGESLWAILLGEREIETAQLPRFAERFFTTFLAAQIAAVLLVTPVYTAGAIAEEKERRTLEFLLATDLSSREIVLSKLVARVATLVLLLVAGLPVLALTQLWGGVDPLLLAGGFVATGATLLSVVSLSVFNSVRADSSLDALLRTYGMLVAFLLAGLFLPGINFGHPGLLLWLLSGTGRAGDSGFALAALTGYAAVHLIATAICVGEAIRNLRGGTVPAAPAPEA